MFIVTCPLALKYVYMYICTYFIHYIIIIIIFLISILYLELELNALDGLKAGKAQTAS